jgi:hypothetical protein
MSNLKDQIKDSKRSIRYNKICHPYIYPEYNKMMDAKLELADAKLRYEEAKRIWKNLGK